MYILNAECILQLIFLFFTQNYRKEREDNSKDVDQTDINELINVRSLSQSASSKQR